MQVTGLRAIATIHRQSQTQNYQKLVRRLSSICIIIIMSMIKPPVRVLGKV